MELNVQNLNVRTYNTIIIGSGAAGLNCALHLVKEGMPSDDIAIITDKLGGGTSFNTGSDKQTYYKMSVIGKQKDSPHEMAKDFFSGGAMHGDIALIEATNSIREFFHLVELGVPFPHDKYGGFVGYKTDNDPKQRATSIGPLTSQAMGKSLLNAVRKENISIFDRHQAIKVILDDETGKACGMITLNLDKLENVLDRESIFDAIEIFQAENVVLATGGPAILYKNSVYPKSQRASLGLAIEAGCKMQNLTESQFGLASHKFRWNVSGSYQQVIPRYVSIDKDGVEHEFLNSYFSSFSEVSKAIFLKGYQWPFSSERVLNGGSSIIDIAVFNETIILNRDVFLDFRNNPEGYEREKLDPIVKDYLGYSNAFGETPLERLSKLNPEAIALYQKNQIDLREEMLGIKVCNQHLNGGVSGDIWYETSVKHLFAIGEMNGSHGIHRPGGAALNAGQVGGLRAAQKIVQDYFNERKVDLNPNNSQLTNSIQEIINELVQLYEEQAPSKGVKHVLTSMLDLIQEKMENNAGIIRGSGEINNNITELEEFYTDLNKKVRISKNVDISEYFTIKGALISAIMILRSIRDYIQQNGSSRGSFLIMKFLLLDKIIRMEDLEEKAFISDKDQMTDKIQVISINSSAKWEKIRPIPEDFGWFENVWKAYKSKEIFKK